MIPLAWFATAVWARSAPSWLASPSRCTTRPCAPPYLLPIASEASRPWPLGQLDGRRLAEVPDALFEGDRIDRADGATQGGLAGQPGSRPRQHVPQLVRVLMHPLADAADVRLTAHHGRRNRHQQQLPAIAPAPRLPRVRDGAQGLDQRPILRRVQRGRPSSGKLRDCPR